MLLMSLRRQGNHGSSPVLPGAGGGTNFSQTSCQITFSLLEYPL